MQFPIELREALLRNVSRQRLPWTGTAGFLEFFSEIFELKTLPSKDSRHEDAYDDMWQHTVNNEDWGEQDILSDERFSPLKMTDEQFESFLNKALSIDVRPNAQLSTFVETVTPILKHARMKLERHVQYGVFEGYVVRPDTRRSNTGPVSHPDMRPSERLSLVERIAGELQSRYTLNDIKAYLGAFEYSRPATPYDGTNSKRVFVTHELQKAPADVLRAIAADLEVSSTGGVVVPPPANWRDTSAFRLFVSHIAVHKDKATRLKVCLEPLGIDAFVAHEDILPTHEWQVEIERALHNMDAFLAIHTEGFKNSFWTQQEIGFAVGKGIKVISFQMGEDPTGFISKKQALARRQRTAEQIAAEIDTILAADPQTAEKLKSAKLAREREETPF